jgi:hypothetical protein
MSKIVYFVIGVDLDAKTPFIDDDTLVDRFGYNEQVWDNDKGEWVEDPDLVLYAEALHILNNNPIAKDGN